MEQKLTENTYALITGGSSGIGKALALELASRGHHIAIVALPNSGQKETIEEITSLHKVTVKSKELNILDEGSINSIMDWIIEEELNIQVLVNNAGVGYAESFNELKPQFINSLLDLNIKTTVLLTHALLPELKKHSKSFVLNLSSAAAFYSMPYKSIYAASKRFVLDFSTSLREELTNDNVSVTAVCPAGVITSTEIRERISQSGIVAQKSALEPDQVAKEAIIGMLKRKAYVVPGRLARIMSYARFVVPPRFQRKMIAKSFRKD